MGRPLKPRKLPGLPKPKIYLPVGQGQAKLGHYAEVSILDFEVMRLVDGHAMTIREAAQNLGVSHSTAGRMLERARRSITLALERQQPLCIDAEDGDEYELELSSTENQAEQPLERLIAIASEDGDPESSVDHIFGRCACFILYNGDGRFIQTLNNPGRNVRRLAAKNAAHCLKQAKVTDIVAGRFGPDAMEYLSEAKISPHIAKGVSAQQIIEFTTQKSS